MEEEKELLSATMVGEDLRLKVSCSRQEMAALIVSLIQNTEWFLPCLELAELYIATQNGEILNKLTPKGDA